MEEIEILEQEIRNLTSQLTSSVSSVGDWKVVKCYEASLVGLEPPYDINALHAERQAIRDRINEIQHRIEEIDRELHPEKYIVIEEPSEGEVIPEGVIVYPESLSEEEVMDLYSEPEDSASDINVVSKEGEE